jgi:peptide/nickel transport system substrate-binding protein
MNKQQLSALAIVTTLVLAACGGEKKDGGAGGGGAAQGLVIAFDGSPANLDPRVGTDTYAGRVWDMTSSGLVKITPTGDFAPDVASSWETPDDKTIIFHLNPNAKFHDGRPVTAKDFKYTYDSMMAPDFPQKAKQSGYSAVSSFEAPDDRTFIIRFKEPNPGIFDNLTYMLVPQGANATDFGRKPVLAGAYKINEFKTDERLVLEGFDQWHGGAPKTKNVTIRIIPDATTRGLELRRGTINFVINSIPLEQVQVFKSNPDFKVQTSHGGAYQYLAFNLKDPILSKKDVRKAIAHAIDRDRIVRDLLHGYGTKTESMFPQGHWARAEGLPEYAYDKAKAMQLLDAAGHRDPDGAGPKPRFRLAFRSSTDEEANQQAQMIQQMLSEVGIQMDIQTSEFQTFMEDVRNGRYQMFSLRRAGISDPDFYYTIFHSASLPPDGQNRGFYINPKVDRLIMEGRSTFDRAKRKTAYDEIQRIVADELPYISLYHRDNVAIMRKNVEGFEMYPAGFLLSVPKMTVN